MRVRKRTALLGRFLTMKLLIKSWPGAYLVGSFFIMCITSPGLVCLAGRAIGRGEFSDCSICVS